MEIISEITKKHYFSSVSPTGTDVRFIKLQTGAVPWAKRQTERWIERNKVTTMKTVTAGPSV